jgi:hypothetical protein
MTATATPLFPTTEVTFVNETTLAASELHIEFEGTSTSSAQLLQNAPGCPSPAVHFIPPHDFEVTVDWGTPCVDAGESVRFRFMADKSVRPQARGVMLLLDTLGRLYRGAIAAMRGDVRE